MADARSSGKIAVALVLGGVAAMFAVNAGGRVYESRDVLRYAQMVLEMRHHGTLVPTQDGVPYHEAAPLAAWGPYFTAWLLGELNPLATRLISALAAFATVVVTLWLGATVSLRVGLFAAAAAATAPLAWLYARMSRIESLLALAVTLAVVAFFVAGRRTGFQRWAAFALSGLGLALGIAAKGPYAVAITGAALGPYLLYERRWRDLLQGGIVVGILALALSAAWIVPYVLYLGPDEARSLYDVFIGGETLAKFQGKLGKVKPFWTYLVEVPPNLAPWSLVAAVAMIPVLRRPSQASSLERLCTSWALFPILLLSLSTGKHVRYVVPLVPAFALLSGIQLDRWLRAPELPGARVLRGAAWLVGGLLLLAGIGALGWFVVSFGPSAHALGAGLACVAGAVAGCAMLCRGRAPASLACLYVAFAGAVSFFYAAVLPLPRYADQSSEYRRLAARIRPELEAGGELSVVAPAPGEKRRISGSSLALHLDNRWVPEYPREAVPAEGLVLSREPIAGRRVRREIDWPRGREWQVERWLLLEPLTASGLLER